MKSFLLLSRASGADGVTLPSFLLLVKEQVASLNNSRGWKQPLFCIDSKDIRVSWRTQNNMHLLKI